jgi:hypothetical protein
MAAPGDVGRRLGALARHLSTATASPAAAPQVADPAPPPGHPGPALFDDAAMMDFVREGYVMFHLDDLPASYHAGIVERLDGVFEKSGNPGNNMLPMVPGLMTMLKHPLVDGALQSILGTDYYTHLHRHPHFIDRIDEGKPGLVHHLHKDSMVNSRFAVDAKRRQHRTRMCMLMYFPQDTPLELGPTAIMPKSHFLLHAPERGESMVPYEDTQAIHCAGPAGTVAIVHYDMLHTSTNKTFEQPRHMIKFLFSRMSEPDSGPSWDSDSSAWQGSDNLQDPIWRTQWDWHCGRPDQPSWDATAAAQGGIESLAAQLHSECEMDAVRAAYTLGVGVGSTVGVETLMSTLCTMLEEESDAQEIASKFNESDAVCQAGYGLVEAGAAAVPALLAAAASPTALIRSRAIDVLGDMGPQASESMPLLLAALADPDEDPRRRAAEAIGTVGCGAPNQAELCAALAQLMLGDHSEQVRRNASYSLARLAPAMADGDASGALVVEALSAGLVDSNQYVRGFSALALERVGTPAAMGAALAHLQVMRFD